MSQNFVDFNPTVVAIAIAGIMGVSMPVAIAQLNQQQVSAMAQQVTVLIQGQNPGSGVIIGQSGNSYFVLTAKHVIATPDEYYIVTPDQQKYPLDYQRIDKMPEADLAVVQFTSDRSYDMATMGNSDQVIQGNIVYIAGWPHPGSAITERIFQFTTGTVSGRSPSGTSDGYELVYTNITRSGMSGGPLFNQGGELIGIHGQSEGQNIYNPDTGNMVSVKAGFNLGIPLATFMQLNEPNPLPPNPSFANPLTYAAVQALGENRVTDAVSLYKRATEVNPEYLEAIFGLGQAYYESGDRNLALSQFEKAVELTRAEMERLRVLSTLEVVAYNNHVNVELALGTLLFTSGDRLEGLNLLVGLLQNNNNMVRDKLFQPDFASSRLRSDAVPLQQYAEKILSTEAGKLPIQFNQGQVLYELGQVQAAIPYFQIILDQYKNDPRVMLALAITLQEIGQSDRADVLLQEIRSEESQDSVTGESGGWLGIFWSDRLIEKARALIPTQP
ncbi:trypsin-like peptidase domain-containing protein [Phormidium pseudopriestleyi FRX01]|uniref:Serine protease n=1 Tax=Phormidium pseudopriestleyi FRX01 TaxID=1759528 RepID=A0ABS3FXZ1_9CYAN|nr:serine protease [Phormidium pseudopriestleyi]MBO0352010.1 trypsin-like peptidase domain-containing protein [Phormidium pseudopriestleyi FRX01]